MASLDEPPLTLSPTVRRLRTVMARLLEEDRDTLAGYPVAPLIKGCWMPSGAGISARGCRLASVAIVAWLRHLDKALANLLPDSGSSLDSIRRQTLDARLALGDLLDCVSLLMAAGSAAGGPATADDAATARAVEAIDRRPASRVPVSTP